MVLLNDYRINALYVKHRTVSSTSFTTYFPYPIDIHPHSNYNPIWDYKTKDDGYG